MAQQTGQTGTATSNVGMGATALEDLEVASGIVEEVLALTAARGQDTRALTPDQRAGYVLRLCRALKLNPLTNPVQFITLNGREVLYLTRTATDQLAAMHGLNRKTIRGPEVFDVGGTKVVLCVVECTLPNGRSETATATLPLADPVNVLMKCETKAKRRGTLSILGLGILTEEELETIPRDRVSNTPDLALTDPQSSTVGTRETQPAPPVEEDSRSWARYCTELPLATTAQAVAVLYGDLVRDLNEEVTNPVAYLEDSPDGDGAATLALRRLTSPSDPLGGGLALGKTDARALLSDGGADVAALLDDARAFLRADTEAPLTQAATWWIGHREAIKASAPARIDLVYSALARMATATLAGDAAATKRAKERLTAQVKAHEPKSPPPDGTDAPRNAAPANGHGGNVATATPTASVQASAAPTKRERDLTAWTARLAQKPVAAANATAAQREATWGHVAGSYLKHRVELASAGIHDEALDATREALRYRGCADADGWIEGVAQHIGDRRRAA